MANIGFKRPANTEKDDIMEKLAAHAGFKPVKEENLIDCGFNVYIDLDSGRHFEKKAGILHEITDDEGYNAQKIFIEHNL